MEYFTQPISRISTLAKDHYKRLLALLLFLTPAIYCLPDSNYTSTGYFGTLNLLLLIAALSTKSIFEKPFKLALLASVLVSYLSIAISGGMLSSGAFHSIIDTTTFEIVGYIPLISWPVIIITLMLFGCGAYCFYTETIYLPLRYKYLLLASIISVTLALPCYRYIVDPSFKQSVKQDYFNALYSFGDMPAYNLYRVAITSFRERYLSRQPCGIALPSHISLSPIATNNQSDIIVIIGESSRRLSYSVYGYGIDSTPNMKKRLKSGSNFIAIDNVYSPAPNTRESIARTLSFATSNTYLREGLAYQTLLDIMQKAGYTTVWITTQDLYTRWDTYSAKIANSAQKIIAAASDGKTWTDQRAIETALLELAKPEKSFVIVHLWGEHSDYSIRNNLPLPTTSIQAIERQIDSESPLKDIEVSYLSSIHHTDSIVDSVFSYIDSTPDQDLAIYFSDHGEVIGKGHGLIPINISSELGIPFVIQGELSAKLSKQINNFRDSYKGIFNTSFFPEVMINTLGGKAERTKDVDLLSYFSIQGYPENINYIP